MVTSLTTEGLADVKAGVVEFQLTKVSVEGLYPGVMKYSVCGDRSSTGGEIGGYSGRLDVGVIPGTLDINWMGGWVNVHPQDSSIQQPPEETKVPTF